MKPLPILFCAACFAAASLPASAEPKDAAATVLDLGDPDLDLTIDPMKFDSGGTADAVGGPFEPASPGDPLADDDGFASDAEPVGM